MQSANAYVRSCISCYQRKLKCDRLSPCSRCKDRGCECTYPENKITRNRAKSQKTAKLSAKPRLANLENEVIGIKNGQGRPVCLYSGDVGSLKEGDSLVILGRDGKTRTLDAVGRVDIKEESQDEDLSDLWFQDDFESERGRSWVAYMLAIFRPPAEDLTDGVFWSPSATDLDIFWGLYCRNVDPIIRILHKPTVKYLLDNFKTNGPRRCGRSAHALVAAIVFIAAHAISTEDSEDIFKESASSLRIKVKMYIEDAFSRADLSRTQDLQALQALTLYITARVFSADNLNVWHTLWSYSALALRMAVAINVHRDGSSLGLSPFDTEMRRRLWWQLILIHVRTNEEFTCNPYVFGGGVVSMPTNISDVDIDPNSVIPYSPREGPTDMTLCLVRFESVAAVSVPSSRQSIEDFEAMLKMKYLDHIPPHPTSFRDKLTIFMIRICVLKMCWVWGFSVVKDTEDGASDSLEMMAVSDELFAIATHMLECQIQLQTEPGFENVQWVLRNFRPWQGVAVILSQLLFRLRALPKSQISALPPMLKEAWDVVQQAFDSFDSSCIDHRHHKKVRKAYGQVREIIEGKPKTAEHRMAIDPSLAFNDLSMEDWDFRSASSGVSESWPMFLPFFSGGGF